MSAIFVREDWTDFRALPTLCRRAGVGLAWLRRVILKELTDNSLDALDEQGTPGRCTVTTVDGGYAIEDAGPGIAPDDVVPHVGRPPP